MLVVSRKESETVLIGDDIAVMIVRIGNGKVRLGIAAPPDKNIRRSELPVLSKAEAAERETQRHELATVR